LSPLELVDDFDRIADELRASRPVAPAALRERVASLGPEPAPRRSLRWPSRRLVIGLAAAALLASVVAAGLTRGSSQQKQLAALRPTVPKTSAPAHWGNAASGRALKAAPVPAESASRLQRYQATLRLRVKNVESLSNATRRAMTLARSLGGYVGEVQYSTHAGKRGGARVVLRVPVGSVQAALTTLTGLGTILQQQTGILDVTRRADRESRQIAKLRKQLETASPQEAPAIRAHLRTLQAKHMRLLRSANLARIVVTLTTPAQAAAAPSRLHQTLDDAGSVLLRELEFLLYALVVAGPLLLLGGAAVGTARAARRRSDRRLLERA
jgi:Domain of unknown function (DUF4349)